MKLFKKITIIIVLIQATLFPCQKAKRGSLWSHYELIDNAQSIVLVKADYIENDKKSRRKVSIKKCKLTVIKVIKGNAEKEYELDINFGFTYSNDFNGHNEEIFWKSDTGRTPFLSGMCGPIQSFESEKTYLFFPDAQGAMKSAELILDSTDKWLDYVIKRVNGEISKSEDFKYITKNIGGFWCIASNGMDSDCKDCIYSSNDSTDSFIYFQILDGNFIRFKKDKKDTEYNKFVSKHQFWYQYTFSLNNDTLLMKNIYDENEELVLTRCKECKKK